MPATEQDAFRAADQAMHDENASELAEYREMAQKGDELTVEYAESMITELRLRAEAVAGRRPFGNFTSPEHATELVAWTARVEYLRGAQGSVQFSPSPANWYELDWQHELRDRVRQIIGTHVDVTVRLASGRHRPGAEPTQLVAITVTPNS